MTDTIETAHAEATEVEDFLHLDPAAIVIGTNVRADLRADHKEFRKSIKERGVLEAVTVYRNDEGEYVLLRGQRRTVTAAEAGTPTGLIPARVVPKPADADRIGDQMVENIHRTEMRETEIVAGVEQLALLGVSAAQIAKPTSIDRPTVNAALAVTKTEQTRNRLEAGDLTLEEAAIFAEHDEDAIERLERARTTRWGDSVEHVAQKLRDEAGEREAYDAEVERLRAEGLPVLSAQAADQADGSLLLEDMRTPEGEPVPAEEWANLSGVAVIVTEDWEYPEPEATEGDEDANTTDEADHDEPVKVYRQMWVVTDIEVCGLVHRSRVGRTDDDQGEDSEGHDAEADAAAEVEAEVRREERRRVIANNKAWTSVMLTERVNRKVDEHGGSPGCRSLIGWNWLRGGRPSRRSARSSSAGLRVCLTSCWMAATRLG